MKARGYVYNSPGSKVTSQTPPPHECQKLYSQTSLMNIKKANAGKGFQQFKLLKIIIMNTELNKLLTEIRENIAKFNDIIAETNGNKMISIILAIQYYDEFDNSTTVLATDNEFIECTKLSNLAIDLNITPIDIILNQI